jgi:hypothetical protein
MRLTTILSVFLGVVLLLTCSACDLGKGGKAGAFLLLAPFVATAAAAGALALSRLTAAVSTNSARHRA